jgi:hypothetical protein
VSRIDVVIRGAGVVVVAGVLAAGGAYVVGDGDAVTRNLWVVTSAPGDVCTRASSPVSYDDAAAADDLCTSLNAAYAAAANSSDTICVKAGSYGDQSVTLDAGKALPATVIDGCEGGVSLRTLDIGNDSGGTQPCCVTFKDMAVTGFSGGYAVFVYWGNTNASSRAADITLDNMDVAVGQPTGGPVFQGFSTLRFTIQNSTFGPACCGNMADGTTTNNSPVGIRFGADTAGGFPKNTDLVLRNNLIQGITRNCDDWLTGFGSCPQSTCINTGDLCHADAIQLWGVDNMVVDRNRLYHNEINGLFLDSTASFVDGTISNNMIGEVMRGDTCFDIDGRGIFGTWNIINNTCGNASGDKFVITHAATMDTNNAVWNWKGNLGPVDVSATTTPSGCAGGSTGVFTYSYNTLAATGSATGCGGNETVGVASFVNTALAPANTMDLHLTGANGNADDKIPAATCAGFTTTDNDGDSRPLDTDCDAGADERDT